MGRLNVDPSPMESSGNNPRRLIPELEAEKFAMYVVGEAISTGTSQRITESELFVKSHR